MLEGISPLPVSNMNTQGINDIKTLQLLQQFQSISGIQNKERVKEEFLAIFYKELLKQSFKPPQFSVGGTENSFMQTFGSDFMVEKLALELAKSGSFSPTEIFPAEIGE